MLKKLCTRSCVMVLTLMFIPGIGFAQQNPTLFGSTNQGDLVEIDLVAGTVSLIGNAPTPGGWTDLALDPAGGLYAVSRHRSEFDRRTHFYSLDPADGSVNQDLGIITGVRRSRVFSDIEFTSGGVLYANRYIGSGGLLVVNPATAAATIPPNPRFGPGGSGVDRQNGGLAFHPITGELWAVESSFAVDLSTDASIFRVDPATGLALAPVVPLGLASVPTGFGFDSLEILSDGTFVGTRGRSSELYEIVPIPSPVSGLAEVSLIPLVFDPTILEVASMAWPHQLVLRSFRSRSTSNPAATPT